MAPRKRQLRSDSATAAVQAAVNVAKGDPMPPEHVKISALAMPHYLHIVRARARDEWNDLQLTVAAQLAECFVEQEEERQELATEGRVLKNERGTMVANPRVSILEQMARRQMALMRTLQMGGRAIGDPRKPLGPRAAEQNARKLKEQVEQEEEDDFLA